MSTNQDVLTPFPSAVERAGVWVVAHALRDAEVKRGGRALPLGAPLCVPVVLHTQEGVAGLLTRASQWAPEGVNLSRRENNLKEYFVSATSNPVVESFLMGHEGTTMSTRRLPELAGTNSKAERLAECRNTVDW